MKIKKVEICGFKSFVDRSVIHIDHEVTAVVGPNGCGKSNIVDAIRWTMGEQSAKNLRGKSMDDVIFNGSETRGPHSFAEVTLTFDNTDGLAPAEFRDYAEIAVTRKLDRQGNSDYFINKAPVRLMDVTQLFLGTGVGAKAYSIIEQGRIGYIVSAKPEDRRHIIEEAAGITKFKAKKKAAERKMEQTRHNLLRISDIVAEIDKNLASLKRQAQKAERYKAYRSEIRDLELHVGSFRWLELTVQQREALRALEETTAIVEGKRAALQVREAEMAAEQLAVGEAEHKVEVAQKQAYQLGDNLRLLEGRIAQQQERLDGLRESERLAERELTAMSERRRMLGEERDSITQSLAGLEEIENNEAEVLAREVDLLEQRKFAAQETESTVTGARARLSEANQRIARAEAVLASFERRLNEARMRLERLRTEREELEARVIDLAQEHEELKSRMIGLRSGKDETGKKREQLEEELKTLRVDIQESERTVDRLRGETTEKRSRLRSLEEIQKRFEGVGVGVRNAMNRFGQSDEDRAAKGVLGLVADRIDCPEEWTRALASALGDRLSWIVLSDPTRLNEIAEFLSEEGKGRATVISQRPRRIVGHATILPTNQDGETDEGVIGFLADLMRSSDGDDWLMRHLLDGVVVVRSLDDARRLYGAGHSFTFVTEAGEVVGKDGSATVGRGEEIGAHMIAVKREVRDLHTVVSTLDGEMNRALARHTELRSGIAERQATLDSARTEAHDVEISIVKTEKDAKRCEEELLRTRNRLEQVVLETEELQGQLNDAQGEESDTTTEIESARSAKLDAEAALETHEAIFEERKALVDEQQRNVSDIRVRAAQAKQKAEGERQALLRLEKSVQELEEREGRLGVDIERGAKQQGETIASILTSKYELTDTVSLALRAEEVLSSARERYDGVKGAIAERQDSLKSLRSQIESLAQSASATQLETRELAIGIDHLLEQIQERHRVDLRKVLGDFHLRELPGDDVKSRIDELLRLVERMGEINLTAIEEYDAQAKRFEYLEGQKRDLDDALSQLDKAIRQMNRESKRMFRETFDSVNERFKQIFPRLFGGGRAELLLTNPDDMLETGVEIIAQPPGKKLGSIELMSGGEKALTAVSLIFSIFQHRPSPFCLLDEVDAPLDEANIGRFCEAIRAMTKHSQFIVITHSKRTMQMADVLYGVTMETPGISKMVAVELKSSKDRDKDKPKAPDFAVA